MIFYGLFILLAVEQVFCFFTGSYPYLYAIPVRTVQIPGLKALFYCPPDMKKCGNLAISTDKERKEVYIRYKYPFGAGGPLFFLGRVKSDAPDRLRLGVCPVTAAFTLYYVILMLSSGKLIPILLVFLMITVLGSWFYRRLINAVTGCLRSGLMKR